MEHKARLVAVMGLVVFGLLLSGPALQSAPQANAKKIDLNTATQAELEGLKGIGPALANKIIAARPFKTVAELKNVSGISEATYEGIKNLVTVRRTTTSARTTEAATTAASVKPKAKTVSEKPVRKTESTTAAGLVDLNSADKATLEALPGVGPSLAEKIIAARPFKSVGDLKNVQGVGDSKFAALKGLVTVRTAAAARTATSRSASAAGAAQKTAQATAAGGLVDLNTADKTALESLPGVGPALADKIIAARPFKSIDDLEKVQGIGPAKFGALKDMVTVGQEEEAVHPKLQPGQTININTATQAELESLLGIGPVRAEAIIAGRPYAAIEDVMKVKGIKEKTFAKIKDYIVVR